MISKKSCFNGLKPFHENTLGDADKSEIIRNQQSAEEFPKPNIRTFEKRKLHSSFIDNVWGANLADMPLINKFNKGCAMSYWYL